VKAVDHFQFGIGFHVHVVDASRCRSRRRVNERRSDGLSDLANEEGGPSNSRKIQVGRSALWRARAQSVLAPIIGCSMQMRP
jgi:hypothetical protein